MTVYKTLTILNVNAVMQCILCGGSLKFNLADEQCIVKQLYVTSMEILFEKRLVPVCSQTLKVQKI